MTAKSSDQFKLRQLRQKRPVLFSLTLLIFMAPIAFAAGEEPPTDTRQHIISKTLDEISGYYKILPSFTKSTATKEDIFSVLQRLRLEFKPRLTKNLEIDLVYDHELLINDFSHTSDFSLIRQKNQKALSWMDADKVITDTDHIYERHLLHRCFLKFESEHSRWLFGKQLIDWGRMRFYSPLDLFNQPLPSDIETDERLGFDALNIELFSDNFSGINFLYGPADHEDKMSYGLRFFKKFGTYDTFLIAARHEKEKVAGCGFDGYLGKAGFRSEFTYTQSGKERYPRAALGVDYSFAAKTTLTAEYFYNGAANGDYDAFANSLTESRKRLSLEKNLISLSALHELTPLLKLKGTMIYDVDGESAFFNPELRYNVKENLDVAVGSQLFVESKGSEFENYNNLYYVELKYFF